MYPPSGDRPLTRGEEIAAVLVCLLFTPLVGVVAYFWWRESSPQRAQSLLDLFLSLVRTIGFVVLAATLILIAGQLLYVR